MIMQRFLLLSLLSLGLTGSLFADAYKDEAWRVSDSSNPNMSGSPKRCPRARWAGARWRACAR